MRFSETIDHVEFLKDLERLGHGKGAVSNIKDLLNVYPEIQKKWLSYITSTQEERVKTWLESLGLLS